MSPSHSVRLRVPTWPGPIFLLHTFFGNRNEMQRSHEFSTTKFSQNLSSARFELDKITRKQQQNAESFWISMSGDFLCRCLYQARHNKKYLHDAAADGNEDDYD